MKNYRVALLEAEHWHVLGHLAAIKTYENVTVAALSGNGEFTKKVSEDLGVKRYPNYLELLDQETDLDFVYIFGIYKEAPEIMEECIRRRIPFMADKPCCERAWQLPPVIAHLKESGVKHCIALQRRYALPVEIYKDFVQEKASEGGVHLVLRYITGTPQRYEDMGFPWANQKEIAGGGALLNLGVHYLDLVQYLTGDEIVEVKGFLNENVWKLGLDDYANLIVKTKQGHTATVEVGYTKSGYPQEDFIFSGKNFYITATAGEDIRRFGLVEGGDKRGELLEKQDFPDIQWFDKCLGSMLATLEGTGEPAATLEDVYHALKFVTQVYEDNHFYEEDAG
ncbi:MAG: Gfo/Idh/MocA family oxidoreductase [Eubacteriales bacterium]|nr:Gfo/Idh/MocA family oxidoreductase [Eubacteriales bacterium]